MSALNDIRAKFHLLTEAEQLSLMVDLIQGGDINLNRSDDFIDALMPLDKAMDAAYDALECAAYSPFERDRAADYADYRYDMRRDQEMVAAWERGQ